MAETLSLLKPSSLSAPCHGPEPPPSRAGPLFAYLHCFVQLPHQAASTESHVTLIQTLPGLRGPGLSPGMWYRQLLPGPARLLSLLSLLPECISGSLFPVISRSPFLLASRALFKAHPTIPFLRVPPDPSAMEGSSL